MSVTSIFASETHVTIPFPGYLDHSITIRKFTRREFLRVIDQDADALWRAAILGLPAVTEVKDGDTVITPAIAAVAPGLVAWTSTAAISAAAIDDLGFDDSEFIGGEILYLARPSLRPVTKAQTADEAAKAISKNS